MTEPQPTKNPRSRAPSGGSACGFAQAMARVAAARDAAAFTEIFDHFAPRIKAYLLRLTGDSGLAEELTQEVMVTMWRKAALYDPAKSSVATWLYTIARNRRIDLARRERRPALDPNDPLLVPDPEPAPDAALWAQERDAKVRDALRLLPEAQLDVLRLAFYDGLTHSEIAARTGLALGTVKSRLRLAFARIRARLDGLEE